MKNISGSNEIKTEDITKDHIVVVDELTPILATDLEKELRCCGREGAGFTHAQ